jgi:hypothetical protein
MMKNRLKVGLFASAILMWSVRGALGQQEVDPTWFNPWPEDKVTAQARVANSEPQRKHRFESSQKRPQISSMREAGTSLAKQRGEKPTVARSRSTVSPVRQDGERKEKE